MVIINDNESEKIVNQLNNNLSCGEQTYRASFYLTGIEMGLSPDNIQKLMQATGKDADEIHGLTLTLSESRALCSVQKLLDNTDYKGHTTTKEIPTILGNYKLPVIYCPITSYLEAYGLKRNAKGIFNCRQRDEAIKALEKLTEKKNICFERRWWQPAKSKKKKGQMMSDFVVTDASLIHLKKLYQLPSLSKQSANIKAGKSKTKRAKYFEIACSPIFIDQIDKKYLEKPYNLFDEIEQAVSNKNVRVKKSIYNLILLLLQGDLTEYKIKRENLIYKLELHSYMAKRQQSRINNVINEAISIAIEIGYLLESKYNQQTQVYHFCPNPDKCSRLRRKTEKKVIADNPPVDLYDLIEVNGIWELVAPWML